MMNFLRNAVTRRNEDGASAVEYGLLVAGIAALIVTVVFLFGNMVSGIFSSTNTSISSCNATTAASAAGC